MVWCSGVVSRLPSTRLRGFKSKSTNWRVTCKMDPQKQSRSFLLVITKFSKFSDVPTCSWSFKSPQNGDRQGCLLRRYAFGGFKGGSPCTKRRTRSACTCGFYEPMDVLRPSLGAAPLSLSLSLSLSLFWLQVLRTQERRPFATRRVRKDGAMPKRPLQGQGRVN